MVCVIRREIHEMISTPCWYSTLASGELETRKSSSPFIIHDPFVSPGWTLLVTTTTFLLRFSSGDWTYRIAYFIRWLTNYTHAPTYLRCDSEYWYTVPSNGMTESSLFYKLSRVRVFLNPVKIMLNGGKERERERHEGCYINRIEEAGPGQRSPLHVHVPVGQSRCKGSSVRSRPCHWSAGRCETTSERSSKTPDEYPVCRR